MNALSTFPATMLFLALALGACGDPTASAGDPGLDQETFIATYVDLRAAVIQGDSHEVTNELRDKVLSDHGVTEEEMVAFVEAHGEDVPFMRAVWDEIETRLDALRVAPGDDGRR